MSLKYKGTFVDIHTDKNDLLYVQFQDGKKEQRWYPAWGDIQYIIDAVLGTERANHGRLQHFIIFSLLASLLRYSIDENIEPQRSKLSYDDKTFPRKKLYDIIDHIRQLHGYTPVYYNEYHGIKENED